MVPMQSVFACVRERDWHIIGGGLPPDVRAECGLPSGLLAALETGGAMAAALDERLAFDGLSTRFLELACAGVPWPVVLVLRMHRAKSRARVPWAAEVLYINECRVRLWHVLRARVIEWRMARAALGIRDFCGDADDLANALYVALLTDRPFTTFEDLALASGVGVRKLKKLWDAVFGATLSRHEFVRRVLVVRGLALADGPDIGSRTVAARLDMGRSSLDGVAVAVTGKTFAQAVRTEGLRPLMEFETRLREAGIVLLP